MFKLQVRNGLLSTAADEVGVQAVAGLRDGAWHKRQG